MLAKAQTVWDQKSVCMMIWKITTLTFPFGVDLSIRLHCHDRNLSVSEYVKDDHADTINNFDTWHATKNVAKELKQCCSGPERHHGKSEDVAQKTFGQSRGGENSNFLGSKKLRPGRR
jgi:hypothetical protein